MATASMRPFQITILKPTVKQHLWIQFNAFFGFNGMEYIENIQIHLQMQLENSRMQPEIECN